MSNTIDDRVVKMSFDNKDFESNAKQSMSTLERLKNALKFDKASDGLANVSRAASKVDFSGMANGVESVSAKFSALQVVAATALAKITSAAMDAGQRIVKGLTIQPAIDGFNEYQTQIGSIQTILANTQKEGTNLYQVNSALDELNRYADKTIYNFTEMTRNIGTFTAAGVKLKPAVSSIKGIANLAALSGSTSAQASHAMYQLSQALATNRVSLMDWNSVVNAGMGGQVFQDALKRTAKNMGKDVDAIMAKYGSFRDSLTNGEWLTADVLTETLTQLSGAYTEADLIEKGYTESQAKDIVKLARTAEDAATKVKTFSALFDSLGEALGSGWTKSWQILIGDFNEAQDLLTEISDVASNAINESSNARNKVLSQGLSTGWKQFLEEGISNEADFVDSIKNVAKEHGVAVDDMMADGKTFEETLKNGWLTSEILSESLGNYVQKVNEMSAEQRKEAGYTADQVEELNKLNEAVQNGSVNIDEFVDKIRRESGRENLIEGLRNLFEGASKILGTVKDSFTDIFPTITGDQLYAFTERFKNLTQAIIPTQEVLDKLYRTGKGFFSVLDIGKQGLEAILKPALEFVTGGAIASVGDGLLTLTANVGDFFTELDEGLKKGQAFQAISKALSRVFSGIATVLSKGADAFKRFFDGTSRLGDIGAAIGDFFGGFFGSMQSDGDKSASILDRISESVQTFSSKIKSIFDTLNSEGGNPFEGFFTAIKNVFDWLKNNISLGDIGKILTGAGIFKAFSSLGKLFGKISSILNMFTVDGTKKAEESVTIKDKIADLLDGVHDSLERFQSGIKTSQLVAISVAIGILAASLKTLASIDPERAKQGLLSMALMFGMLTGAFKGITAILDSFKGKGNDLGKAALTLIAVSVSLKNLAKALKTISEIDPDQLGPSLVALGLGLAGICAGLKALNRVDISVSTSIAILAISEACKILADALKSIGELSWDEVARGALGMAVALEATVVALQMLDDIDGDKSKLAAAASLYITVLSLKKIAEALKDIGSLSWDEIARGVSGLGVALEEIVVALQSLDDIEGNGSKLAASASLLIAVQSLEPISEALKNIGSMDWPAIWRGLIGIGGALAEVSGAIRVISGIEGNGSKLAASASLLIAVQSLKKISDAVNDIGSLSWTKIGRGLTGLGLALGELVASIMILSSIDDMGDGGESLRASLSLVVVAISLKKVAEALTEVGSLSWDEVKRGIYGLGGTLIVMAAVVRTLGDLQSDMGFHGIMGSTSLVILMSQLDRLSDSFQKIGSMDWPQVGAGLGGMAGAIAIIGGAAFVTGLGGLKSIVGSVSIALVTSTLTELADALVKIGSMSWDQIQNGVEGMGAALGVEGLAGMITGLAGLEGALGGISISVISHSLGDLADAVKEFASMSWDELNRGIQGMANALAFSATGGLANLLSGLGAPSIALIAGPLGDLAGAVKKWSGVTIPDGIGWGLTRLAFGVKSFTDADWGAGAIATVAEPLGIMASSVKKWASVKIPEGLKDQLDGLAKGVESFTLGGFGADTISSVAAPLGRLANSVEKWAGITVPSDIQKSLESLGNGVKAWVASVGGGTAIEEAAGPVGTLADSIRKWDGVTVPANLKDNLTSLAEGVGAFFLKDTKGLAEVARPLGTLADSVRKWDGVAVNESIKQGLIDLAMGVREWTPDKNGGWNIGQATGPLGDLADAIRKWDGVTVPEGIQSNLEQLANGVKAFFLTDPEKFSASVGPIGTLADSVRKWDGVNVPSDMQSKLEGLGKGVLAFNGTQGNSLNDVVGPLGTLADSVRKWDGLAIPDGIQKGLETLAIGIAHFVLVKPDNFTQVVGPLGTLADSVRNWSGVTVPENLQDNLVNLADGIRHFNTIEPDGLAGVAGPVGTLADSVRNWDGVVVPPDMQSVLTSLAEGVKSFNDVDTGKLSDIVAPLGGLSDSVQRWTGVTIPDDLQSKLYSLSEGARACSNIDAGSLGEVTGPLGSLADAVQKWNDVVIPESAQTGLTSLATGFQAMMDIDVTNATTIADAVDRLSGIDFSTAATSIQNFAASLSSLSTVQISTDSWSNLGDQLVSGLVNSINAGQGRVTAAVSALGQSAMAAFAASAASGSSSGMAAGMALVNGLVAGVVAGMGVFRASLTTIISSGISIVASCTPTYTSAGRTLASAIGSGISSGQSYVTAGVGSALSSATGAIRSYYGSFSSAGSFIASGLAAGIRSGAGGVYAAAYSIAAQAARAARNAVAVKSPSRVFRRIGEYIGEGLVIGIDSYDEYSSEAGSNLGKSAISGIQSAVSKISDAVDVDMDFVPTITPVVNLDNVQSSADAINSMFGSMSIDAFGQVDQAMGAGIQNGQLNDIAMMISNLGSRMNSPKPEPSYNIYIDGARINDDPAIQQSVINLMYDLKRKAAMNVG